MALKYLEYTLPVTVAFCVALSGGDIFGWGPMAQVTSGVVCFFAGYLTLWHFKHARLKPWADRLRALGFRTKLSPEKLRAERRGLSLTARLVAGSGGSDDGLEPVAHLTLEIDLTSPPPMFAVVPWQDLLTASLRLEVEAASDSLSVGATRFRWVGEAQPGSIELALRVVAALRIARPEQPASLLSGTRNGSLACLLHLVDVYPSTEEVQVALESAWASSDPDLRLAAAQTMGPDALGELVRDSGFSLHQRKQALLGSVTRFPEQAATWADEIDEGPLAAAAAYVHGALQQLARVPWLAELASSRTADKAEAAISALAQMPDAAAEAPLLALLKAGTWRAMVVDALGRCGTADVIPALRALPESPEMRPRVERAIADIAHRGGVRGGTLALVEGGQGGELALHE